jgi:hypothetical protein
MSGAPIGVLAQKLGLPSSAATASHHARVVDDISSRVWMYVADRPGAQILAGRRPGGSKAVAAQENHTHVANDAQATRRVDRGRRRRADRDVPAIGESGDELTLGAVPENLGRARRGVGDPVKAPRVELGSGRVEDRRAACGRSSSGAVGAEPFGSNEMRRTRVRTS